MRGCWPTRASPSTCSSWLASASRRSTWSSPTSTRSATRSARGPARTSASSRSTSAGRAWSGQPPRTTPAWRWSPTRRTTGGCSRRWAAVASPSSSDGRWPPRHSAIPRPTTWRWPPGWAPSWLGTRCLLPTRSRRGSGRPGSGVRSCVMGRTRTSRRRSTWPRTRRVARPPASLGPSSCTERRCPTTTTSTRTPPGAPPTTTATGPPSPSSSTPTRAASRPATTSRRRTARLTSATRSPPSAGWSPRPRW